MNKHTSENTKIENYKDTFEYYTDLKKLDYLESINSINKLNVFDFDNTLFYSPGPNPNIWDSHAIGLLKSECLGWYQNRASIDLDHINPAIDWFDKSCLNEAKNRLQNNKSELTILLTGRGRDGFLDVIKSFLDQANLDFPFYALKENKLIGLSKNKTKLTTFDFKKRIILEILHKFPSIRNIEIFEDRPSQIEKFEELFGSTILIKDSNGLENRKYNVKINKIELESIYYPLLLEYSIIQQLIDEYRDKSKDCAYEINTPDIVLSLDTKCSKELTELLKSHDYKSEVKHNISKVKLLLNPKDKKSLHILLSIINNSSKNPKYIYVCSIKNFNITSNKHKENICYFSLKFDNLDSCSANKDEIIATDNIYCKNQDDFWFNKAREVNTTYNTYSSGNWRSLKSPYKVEAKLVQPSNSVKLKIINPSKYYKSIKSRRLLK